MSSLVALASVISEQAISPTTASSSNGSKRIGWRVVSVEVVDAAVDRALGRRAHQKVADFPVTSFFCTPNQSERIRRAAGAAVSAPKPPCSTVTATTIGRAWSGA